TPTTTTVDVVLDSDNPGANYSESGSWTNYTGLGHNNDLRYAAAGNGSVSATWQVTGLGSGNYDVAGTWDNNSAHATNATYKVYDGSTLVATWTVDQKPAPSGGGTLGGVAFQNLGTVSITSGTLKVVLDNNA